MTMATVAYKRRMFQGQLLKARPMARSRVTTVTTEFVKNAKTERNSENFYFFWFFIFIFFTPTFFSQMHVPSGYYLNLF
jgi:hypothetical protein